MSTEGQLAPQSAPASTNLSLGDVVTASLLLCTFSGLALQASYDPHNGARVIAEWLLARPGLALLRAVHYWTAQLFVVSAALLLWQHLRSSTASPTGRLARAGLALVVPAVAFLMASGFLLRGDADAHAFQPWLTQLITELPYAGPFLVSHLFGREDIGPTFLFHHAVTAPIFLWAIFAFCSRRHFPRPATSAMVAGITIVAALLVSPGLNDGLDQRTTGPWLFLGAREMLHWLPQALFVVALGLAALWLGWALPRFSPAAATRVRFGLRIVVGGYALFCGIGLFWPVAERGRTFHWPNARGDWRPATIYSAHAAAPTTGATAVPMPRGRPEGCLICHDNLTGFSSAHRPEAIGCAACHGGDTTTLDAGRAHAAMVRIPGNLADAPRTCGTAGCHPEVVPRVERSIMATFSGVIAVDRRVFGEKVDPASPPPHVRDLGSSAADSHVRQLCASCHLGQEKSAWGPIVEESRGGGCNACHLIYSPEATRELARYEATPRRARTAIPSIHPTLTVNPTNAHCFGCHSRSGRISTNYEGWHELRDPPPSAELKSPAQSPQYRRLDDGRYFTRVTPDVHQTRGLDCIDCHTSTEVMGGGHVVKRKSEQLQVRCEDCHARPLASKPLAATDTEAQKLLGLRQWAAAPEQRFGATRSGGALINVFTAPDGSGQMRRKRTGGTAELRAPLAVCREGGGHARLSCASCHTPWAPRCTTCHTSFDPAAEAFDHLRQEPVQGAWMEKSGAFEVAPPTLGIRLDSADAARPHGVIDTIVPGMIMELDRNRTVGGPPDPVFLRLYAPMAAHTISRESRSCPSCHNNPVALGFGRGDLRYEVSGAHGRWRFTPEHGLSPQDGLPADAWSGFLQNRAGLVSTRDDVRPFNVEEQRRILRVGACLTCHAGDSSVMRQSVTDFEAILAGHSPRCVLPDWP